MSSFVDTVIYFSNQQFLRCMEHPIHVGMDHFIQVVVPISAHVLVMKIQKASCDAQLDHDNNEDVDDEAADFTISGDTICKSLALVNQVRKSNI